MGFEPTTTGITIQDSTAELQPPFLKLARPTGFEPVTPGLEGRCSIRMSYGRFSILTVVGRGGGIRTPDILLPKQVRYQTALHPASVNYTWGQTRSCRCLVLGLTPVFNRLLLGFGRSGRRG